MTSILFQRMGHRCHAAVSWELLHGYLHSEIWPWGSGRYVAEKKVDSDLREPYHTWTWKASLSPRHSRHDSHNLILFCPVCAISVVAITNCSHPLYVFVPLPYIQQVKTFEQRHTIKWSQWMPMKQIRVLIFTNNLKNREAEMKPRVVWDIPNDSFIPSFPHRTVTLRPRMINEEFKGSFMGFPTQTRTDKSSIFYILRKMNSSIWYPPGIHALYRLCTYSL